MGGLYVIQELTAVSNDAQSVLIEQDFWDNPSFNY